MKLAIFHVSDIHMETHNETIPERISQLGDYAAGVAAGADHILWALTGDISNGGKFEQVQAFLTSFSQMVTQLESRHPCVSQKVVAVPGNHDVDVDLPLPMRETAIKAIKSGVERNITATHIATCVEAQCGFSEALTKAGIEHCGDALSKKISIEVGTKKIELILVNSAWLSEKKETYGQVHLPAWQIEQMGVGTDGDLTIVMLHHPVSWFDQTTQRTLRDALESSETICLFGHEHESDARAIQPLALSGELPTIVIDGGVFHQAKSGSASSFNVIELNVADQRLLVNAVSLKDGAYRVIESAEREFAGARSALRKKSRLRNTTLQWAESHELQLFKGSVSNPTLRQLYVFPQADDVAASRASRGFEHVLSTRDLVNGSDPALLFVGTEKSGKTALLKAFFGHLWAADKIPVYVGGEELARATRDHVARLIDKAYHDQYDVEKNQSWFSLPTTCQVLLIDDVDQARLSPSAFPTLFKIIADLAPRVVMSSTDMFNLEGPAFQALSESPKRPRLLRLRHFGNVLRDELALAWLRLDRPADITDIELLPEAESLRKRLNQILCDDVVPKTPFFLLTILQSLGEAPNSELTKSALGYYYEFLLTNGLLRAGVATDQLRKYHSFFTELAFFLLSKGRTNLLEMELKSFHANYVEEYELKLEWRQLLKVGQVARVLGRRDEVFCFYYSYQFLFYAGKALANRLDSGSGIDLFRHLLARSYNIDIANIVLFIAHHTRHQMVIDELLDVCDALFKHVTPLLFAEDVAEINTLVSNAPKLYATNKATIETRRERLSDMDKADEDDDPPESHVMLLERRENQLTLDFESSKTLDSVTGIERLNVASKFVEIVGQALRNHHSEIPKAQKTRVVKAGTLLSLRCANYVISGVARDFADFVPQFSENLDPSHRVEFYKKFGRAVFGFLGMIAMGHIKLVSRSFAYGELTDTYNRVFSGEPWLPTDEQSAPTQFDLLRHSKGLIALAIQLEEGGSLPFKSLQALKIQFQGNMLPEIVLRFLVLDHIYMYPTSTQDKQRIYSLLNIDVKTQEAIQSRSNS